MKKIHALLAIAVGGVLLGVGFTVSAQPATKPGYATVVHVKGMASYSLNGGVTKIPLVAGKFLEAGATIYTGDDGVVDIILGKSVDLPQASDSSPTHISYAIDAPVRGFAGYTPSAEQNAVRVMSSSTLVIDKLNTTSTGADTVGDTELDLQKGGLYASVKKLSAASQYLVKTPTGIAGVRGTEFAITLNPDGTIKDLQVFKTRGDDGVVLAVTQDGTTQTYVIKDGMMYVNGNPNPVAIPPQVMVVLGEVFSLLHTHFFQLISYDFDHTTTRESGDFGY